MNGECEELRKANRVAHKFEDTINKTNSKLQQQKEKKIISSMKKDLFYTPRRKESTL